MDTIRAKILDALTLFYDKIKSVFVRTTNVVNNCASTSTSYPLSAAQGTNLQGQIDDINSTLNNTNNNIRLLCTTKIYGVEVNLPPLTYQTYEFDVSIDGYKALGVIGYEVGNIHVQKYESTINSSLNILKLGLFNSGNQDLTNSGVNAYVNVIYIKDV